MRNNNFLFHAAFICIAVLFSFSADTYAQTVKPKHKEASYSGESVTLENKYLKLILFKRKSGEHPAHKDGWGWGELYGPDANGKLTKYLGVLEYLGEVDVVGHVHLLRLEASEYKIEKTDKGQKIIFDVALQIPEEACMVWDNHVAVTGKVILALPDDQPVMKYHLEVKPDFRLNYRSLKGPWIRIGAYAFGSNRTDAIFPGLEWLINDEWSSSTNYHSPLNHMRVAPHPYKVTAPLMAISYDGLAVGLCWDPHQGDFSTLNRIRSLQPVFASPNFIDNKNENLLGLMYPSVCWGMEENALAAKEPLVMFGGGLKMDAEIVVIKGNSMDVILNWIKRNGMPDPGKPRYSWNDALDKFADLYNTRLWINGNGWSMEKGEWSVARVGSKKPLLAAGYAVPQFLEYYIKKGNNKVLVKSMTEKVKWCYKQGYYNPLPAEGKHIKQFPDFFKWNTEKEIREFTDDLLSWQNEYGSFLFDPLDRHSTPHNKMSRAWKPIGQPGDSVLELYVSPAIMLLLAGEYFQDQKYTDAAKKALETAMPMERPEGGDWWETPLHSPNTLTAGRAAIAYYLAYRVFNDEKYLQRSRHFIRTLLPFTYLWEPREYSMLYNTKPLFGSTGWHYMAWTDRCVIWEILSVFSLSGELGIDWAKVDTEVDWNTFQKGITIAGMRWLTDHTDPSWVVCAEELNENITSGKWDMLIADTYDPVANAYGGLGGIRPCILADNIIQVLSRIETRK